MPQTNSRYMNVMYFKQIVYYINSLHKWGIGSISNFVVARHELLVSSDQKLFIAFETKYIAIT